MYSSRLGLFAVCILLAVSGCRTYGGYDSEEATYEQILRSVELFESELRRARANVTALQDAATQNQVLTGLAEQYALYVEAGEALLEVHQNLAAELSPGSPYRTLHRVHGAMMAQHRTATTRLGGLLQSFSDAYAPDTTGVAATDRPYALIPPYYARVAQLQQEEVSLNDILQLVDTTDAPADFQFEGVEPQAPPTQEAGHH